MANCSNQLAPDDEDLLVYIYGEEPLKEERKQHLEHCPTCQQRLKDYQQINDVLRPGIYRASCPSATRLTFYCANMLPADEKAVISEHLRECYLCSDEVRNLRFGMDNFIPFPEPPQTSLSESAQVIERIIARPTQLVLSVSRGPHSWPQYYQAGDSSLSLHLSQTSNGQKMLLGIFITDDEAQIKGFAGSAVELYSLGEVPSSSTATQPDEPAMKPLMTVTVDPLGHFSISPLHPGEYSIIVRLPVKELLIEQIKLE